MNKEFIPPFRVGKKQKRAVLDSKGLEIVIFPKSLGNLSEELAKEYCEFKNNQIKNK